MTSKTRQLVRIVFLIGIVYTSAFGVLLSLRFALGTEFPVVIVKGPSMIPTYYDGDLLIVQGVPDKNTLKPQNATYEGDILIFHSPFDWDTLIVHRVVEKTSVNGRLVLFTKGDNNPIRDPWRVYEENVVGIVIRKIPYAGGVVNAIQSPYGLGLLFTLMVCVIIIDVLHDKE